MRAEKFSSKKESGDVTFASSVTVSHSGDGYYNGKTNHFNNSLRLNSQANL
jgi:hypothetical protein